MEIVLTWIRACAERPQPKISAARWAVRALFFMNGALFATWASRIPAVQSALHLTNGQLGLALLAMALGAVVAMPVAGAMSARVGSGWVCRVMAVLYCLALPGLALAPNLPVLAVCLFCFGAVHGGLDVAMNAQAVAVEKRFGRSIMSSFHALWSLGGMVGAGIGGLVAGAALSPVAHFFAASLVLGAMAVASFGALETEGGSASTRDRVPLFALPSGGLVALGGIAFCIMIGEGAMADWSAVYLRSGVGTGESMASAGYAAFSISMAAGRFLGDTLAARFGPVALVRVGGLIAAFGMAFGLLSGGAVTALIGFACVGIGFSTVVPMVFSAAGNTPGVSAGVALASVTTLGYAGFLIGPPSIGFIAQLCGLKLGLGIIVMTSLLASVLSPWVGRGGTRG
jgi:MFS family permease